MDSTPKSTKKCSSTTASSPAYNTPCRRIGLRRLDNSSTVAGSGNSSAGTPDDNNNNNNNRLSLVGRSRILQFSSPVQQENVPEQYHQTTNTVLQDLNANESSLSNVNKTPIKTIGNKNDLITTTPTFSSHNRTAANNIINRRQLIKRKSLINDLTNDDADDDDDGNKQNNVKRKCCGLSKTTTTTKPQRDIKSSECIIINKNEIQMNQTNHNNSEMVTNTADIYKNNNINELKSSIRLWTEGFKKALEILEEKFATSANSDDNNSIFDREAILRKFNITLNLSDYENL